MPEMLKFEVGCRAVPFLINVFPAFVVVTLNGRDIYLGRHNSRVNAFLS